MREMLQLIVQFKIHENTHGGVLLAVKLQAEELRNQISDQIRNASHIRITEHKAQGIFSGFLAVYVGVKIKNPV